MSRRRKVEIGTVRGRCGSCGEPADLTLYEIRLQRSWRNLFQRNLDRRIDRQVKCSACGRRYAVRTSDLSALTRDE